MVAAFDYCLHGKGGAAPSIDTAMHGLVDAAHVDHLHPDSGIAIATAADGEAADHARSSATGSSGCRGAGPASSSGLDIAAISGDEPAGDRLHPRRPRHHRVGRHQRGGEAQLAVDHPTPPQRLHRRARHGRAVRRRRCPGYEPLPDGRAPGQGGRARPDDPRPRLAPTSRRSGTSPTPTSCSTSWPRASTRGSPRSAPRCPDHFLRTKVKPLVLDLPADAPVEDVVARLKELHEAVPRRLPGLLRPARRPPDSPGDARRRPGDRAGPRRRHVLASARTSRPPASPASSTSTRST